jgi:pSer/pThr/pTyr-binding forkhead associated (FHA) protein
VDKAAQSGILPSSYLTVDDDSVYEIAPNTVLNIGRLDTNDIILDDYKVSREHALLKFSRSDITLVDLASTHGSFVNGERIERSKVFYGDTIHIAGHELKLSSDIPGEITTDTGSVVVPKRARSLDRRIKFFGGLNEFPLITLVQFLHQEKQSGLLLLEIGQQPGPRLYFQDGDIIHVSQGDGLAELIVRKNHEESLFFYFHHETNFPRRTILQSTPNYLMTLCHSIDEKKERDTAAIWIAKPQAETSRVPLPPLVW